MRKYVSLSVLIFFFVCVATAQTKPGDKFLGGGFAVYSTSVISDSTGWTNAKGANYSIMPAYQVQLKNNAALIFQLTGSYSRQKSIYNTTFVNQLLVVGAGVYYQKQKWFDRKFNGFINVGPSAYYKKAFYNTR